MLKILIPLVFLTATHLLQAQLPAGSISGRVTDQDGDPLIGANVILKGTLLGAATDADGRYSIRRITPGSYTLKTSMIGYETVELSISVAEMQNTEHNFKLNEAMLRTGEVVVTAGKRPQSLDDIPMSIAIYDSEQIEARTNERLDDALRYISGVNLTESQINIRGSSGYSRGLGSRVLVLVDGIPMLSGDAGEVKFDVIPMYSIDRIEVVKGAGSALYGSNALGGVVNIITREPRESFLNVRMYSGMYDDPHYDEWKWWGDSPRYFNGLDALHGNVAGDFKYLISAGVRNNQSYRQNDDYLRLNFGGKGIYEIDPEQKLSMSVNYASDTHGNWIYWKDIRNALVPPDDVDLSETVISEKLQLAAHYQRTLSSSFTYSVKSGYYRTHVDISSDTSDFSFRPNDRVESTAQSAILEFQGTYAFNSDDILTFGLDGSYNHVDAIAYGNRSGYSVAVYAQNDYAINDDANLSAGLRYDLTSIEDEDIDGQLSPKLGLSYSLPTGTQLRTSFGLGFRSPSIAERYTSVAAGVIRTKPNPDLKSESSVSYEIGVKQILPLPVIIDAAVFLNQYSNLVEPLYDTTDAKIVFENITKARIFGAEISINAVIVPDFLDINVGYTYMDPRDLTPDENGEDRDEVLKYRPKHLLYAASTVRYAGFTLGADFRYIGRIENIDAALSIPIKNADERVPIYVTDVRLGYDFETLGLPLKATFAVRNLFQYNYSEIVGNIAPIRNYMLTIDTRL